MSMAQSPRLIVFDLVNFLLSNGRVYDGRGHRVKHYKEVPSILKSLKSQGFLLAVASRTRAIESVNRLLDAFEWNQYFSHREIYPGSKLQHFQRFHAESGIEYKDMIFFDDEHRNIVDVSKLVNIPNLARLQSGSRGMSMACSPKLIVFDLDYTLWPFWVDTHVDPPFEKKSDGDVYDSRGHRVKYYKDTPSILKNLKSQGFLLAVASRTSAIEDANKLLALFEWNRYFSYKEIYPGSKLKHFQRFHTESGIEYKDMIFFDDEHRNIVDVSKLGVLSVLVDNGINLDLVNETLQEFAKR